MGFREGVDDEALRDVLLDPCGELRGGGGVGGDNFFEAPQG